MTLNQEHSINLRTAQNALRLMTWGTGVTIVLILLTGPLPVFKLIGSACVSAGFFMLSTLKVKERFFLYMLIPGIVFILNTLSVFTMMLIPETAQVFSGINTILFYATMASLLGFAKGMHLFCFRLFAAYRNEWKYILITLAACMGVAALVIFLAEGAGTDDRVLGMIAFFTLPMLFFAGLFVLSAGVVRTMGYLKNER